ncbi:hypothetical protein WAX87_10930 [Photobacterium damselae subsp. damselae]|uniref:hypothetical protein n=1 Tax=Photobacterium damselae TaxID=38293 RepID=UPI00311ADC32
MFFIFLCNKKGLFSNKKNGSLFVHSDIGLKMLFYFLFFKFIKKCEINVYEEGVGTYTRIKSKSKFKNKIIKLFKVPYFFGGGLLTSSIYLFNREKYQSVFSKEIDNVNINEIKIKPNEYIRNNIDRYSYLFNIKDIVIPKGNLALYLSSWTYDLEKIIELTLIYDHVFVKLHPHFINIPKSILDLDSVTIIESSLPIEIYLLLIPLNNKVNVYHYNSSVAMYINSENLNFIGLNDENS